jgi:hypothetical protein
MCADGARSVWYTTGLQGAVSWLQSTISLLGPFKYSSQGALGGGQAGGPVFGFAGQGGGGGEGGGLPFPSCFFFEEAPSVDVRPYVANACTYVRSVGGGRCYADVRETRETVVFLDVRVVPKADAAPLLDIPRVSRVVQERLLPL